jgi:hypothetical protein
METRLICWERPLQLDPEDPDLIGKVSILLSGARHFMPSPRMSRFVCALVGRFPERGCDEIVWARRPLSARMAGSLISLSIKNSHFDLVMPCVEDLAREHGLLIALPKGRESIDAE